MVENIYGDWMNHKAIVIGSTGGIGAAISPIMKNSPLISEVVSCSRTDNSDDYNFDYENEQSIADIAADLKSRSYKPTVIFVATGLLSSHDNRPETQIGQIHTNWAQKNFLINAIGPALIAKHFLPLMPRSTDIYFGALSAKVGSISDNELGGWHSYRASKAALNMFIKNLAIEWSRKNKLSRIVALHPGTVDTPLSKPFQRNVKPEKLFEPSRAATQMLDILLSSKPEVSGSLLSWDGSIIAP